MKRHAIEILENVLANWEDMGFFLEREFHLSRTICGEEPSREGYPALNWRQFRDHLMTACGEDASFDADRFLDPDSFVRGADYYGMLPYALWHWTASGRKAYEIELDLQALLRHTVARQGFSREDMRFPQESFLLLMKAPIKGRAMSLERDYVAILVFPTPPSQDGVPAKIGFLLLSDSWLDYRALGAHGRDRITREVNRGNIRKALLRIERKRDAASMPDQAVIGAMSIEELIREAGETSREYVVPEIARILVGFVLYLGMLPPGSPHRSDWERPKLSRPDPKAIVSDADICTVTSLHTLSAREREFFLSESVTTGREVCVHKRDGYFRRKRGQGQNPLAPRTEWVRPTLVRKDRLGPGELPGGSLTRLR